MIQQVRPYIWTGVSILALVTLGAIFLREYFVLDLKMALGLLIAPFLISNVDERKSHRLLIVLIPVVALSFFFHLKFLYFVCLATFFLWYTESNSGKVSFLLFGLVFIVSPVYTYLSSYISMDVRLGLTSLASGILNAVGISADAKGNILVLNGAPFEVDKACAGLQMLSLSLLMGLFFIDFHQRKRKKELHLVVQLAALLIVLGFNILSNLLRIIILALFSIPADSSGHQVVGVLALIVYSLVPSYFLISWMVKKWGGALRKERFSLKGEFRVLPILMLVPLAISGYLLKSEIRNFKAFGDSLELEGFETVWVNPEVVKLSNDSCLIYVKMIKSFYGIEHNPLVCWKGSGFELKGSEEKQFDHKDDFRQGQLVREEENLHTAWWFSNGKNRTSDNFSWRYRVIRGEPDFVLVNVTAETESDLERNLKFIVSSPWMKDKQ